LELRAASAGTAEGAEHARKSSGPQPLRKAPTLLQGDSVYGVRGSVEFINQFQADAIGSPWVSVSFTKGMIAADFRIKTGSFSPCIRSG
jgi:hypothetical protein